jgi:hypothetical protein
MTDVERTGGGGVFEGVWEQSAENNIQEWENKRKTKKISCRGATRFVITFHYEEYTYILNGKIQGESPLGTPRLRRKDNIKINLKEICCEGVG